MLCESYGAPIVTASRLWRQRTDLRLGAMKIGAHLPHTLFHLATDSLCIALSSLISPHYYSLALSVTLSSLSTRSVASPQIHPLAFLPRQSGSRILGLVSFACFTVSRHHSVLDLGRPHSPLPVPTIPMAPGSSSSFSRMCGSSVLSPVECTPPSLDPPLGPRRALPSCRFPTHHPLGPALHRTRSSPVSSPCSHTPGLSHTPGRRCDRSAGGIRSYSPTRVLASTAPHRLPIICHSPAC